MLKSVKASLRKIGNSQGLIIPKSLIELLGIEENLEMSVENGALVLRKPVVTDQNLDALDAQRFRKLTALLSDAHNSHDIEGPGIFITCATQYASKGMKVLKAELTWENTSEEPLDLASAIDKLDWKVVCHD